MRNECKDVVVLRTVHRLDDGDAGMAEDVRAAYRADGEKFVRVVGRLADCKWKVEEHAWLSQRNRSRLMRTEAGRRQLATEFDDPTRPAVLLMDGRVRNRAGKDGAEQRNAVELRRLSRRTGKLIVACRRRESACRCGDGRLQSVHEAVRN